jgi:DNA repair exonuclease SbcCD ATPase subunit
MSLKLSSLTPVARYNNATTINASSATGLPLLQMNRSSSSNTPLNKRCAVWTFLNGLQQTFQPTSGAPILDLNPLKAIFLRMTREENKTIKEALDKPRGYFFRLFSNESWEEWLEDKSALGKVVDLFKACSKNDLENPTLLKRHLKKNLDIDTLKRANENAKSLIAQMHPGESAHSVTRLDSAFHFVSSSFTHVAHAFSLPGAAAADDISNLKKFNENIEEYKKRANQVIPKTEEIIKSLQRKIAEIEEDIKVKQKTCEKILEEIQQITDEGRKHFNEYTAIESTKTSTLLEMNKKQEDMEAFRVDLNKKIIDKTIPPKEAHEEAAKYKDFKKWLKQQVDVMDEYGRKTQIHYNYMNASQESLEKLEKNLDETVQKKRQLQAQKNDLEVVLIQYKKDLQTVKETLKSLANEVFQ